MPAVVRRSRAASNVKGVAALTRDSTPPSLAAAAALLPPASASVPRACRSASLRARTGVRKREQRERTEHDHKGAAHISFSRRLRTNCTE